MNPRKVFVFALPRSGSTHLCDLLTVPGRSLVLHEPMMLRRFGDGRERRVFQALRASGIDVDMSPSQFARGTPARQWFDQQVIPKLGTLDFWGVKEVYLTDAQQLIATYTPSHIILLWRDPKDVALSLLELMNRSLMSYGDLKTLKDEAWALESVRESAENLFNIAATTQAMKLRYEDLMSKPAIQQSLLEYVGMTEFSDISLALADEPKGARGPEVLKHHSRFSTASLKRWSRERPGWRRTFAKVCHAAVAEQAAHFGYVPPHLEFRDVCAGSTSPASIRVSEPSYMPNDEFDFAYARRRARKQVCPILLPGARVLDIGAATASLAFMATQADVTVVDDGEPGKRLLSKPWRAGVFPRLEQFDVVTFLFSLEFTDNPRLIVRKLLERNLQVIVSYHCLDDLPLCKREKLEFTSHLTRRDWASFAAECAVKSEYDWAFDGYQSLMRFMP